MCLRASGCRHTAGSENIDKTASRDDSACVSIAHQSINGTWMSSTSSLRDSSGRTMANASAAGKRRAVAANWLRTATSGSRYASSASFSLSAGVTAF